MEMPGGGGGEEAPDAGVMVVEDLGAEGTGRMVGWSRRLAPEVTPCVHVPGPTPSSPLCPPGASRSLGRRGRRGGGPDIL